MRRVIPVVLAASLLAALPATAAPGDRKFQGQTSEDGNVQFAVSKSGKRVVRFRFVNRCPSDSAKGNLVPGRFKIRRGKTGILKFSHKDSQFTIKGRFVSGSKAKGTAQNDTGNCHSGKLNWTATAR
jgi:hypothetical protein